MTIADQPDFDPRLAWASEGGTLLAGACPVLVVVDILRFTTAVEVAVTRGARVVPERWAGREAAGRVGRDGPGGAGRAAALFDPGPTLSSLSPVSLLGVPAGARVVLASPNGASLSLDLAGTGAVVLAGCLRNASAVAAAARDLGGPVGVVAAGELRGDGSLRPAVEDLIGAGAILHALGGRTSPEARAAVAAFLDAAPDLASVLVTCTSGRELADRGLADDLRMAAEHDVSQAVPRLSDGGFAQLS
jgi:2-phosphosulfolactate phosphatase